MREIKEIIGECRDLHIIPPPICWWKLQVDETLPIEFLSQSWVRNAYNVCSTNYIEAKVGSVGGEGCTAWRYTSGNYDYTNFYRNDRDALSSTMAKYRASAGQYNKGIIVGTDNTAESFNDYKINSPIVSGVGSGQLEYSAVLAPDLTWDSDEKKWTCVYSRRFLNNSGGSVTIKEIGVYPSENVCFARDVLSSPITLSDTQQLTVEYTIEFYYP